MRQEGGVGSRDESMDELSKQQRKRHRVCGCLCTTLQRCPQQSSQLSQSPSTTFGGGSSQGRAERTSPHGLDPRKKSHCHPRLELPHQ